MSGLEERRKEGREKRAAMRIKPSCVNQHHEAFAYNQETPSPCLALQVKELRVATKISFRPFFPSSFSPFIV